VNEIGDLLSGPWATLGFGGVAGAAVGYAAKKLTKLAAFVLGGVFILLQILVYVGFIEVHWEQVQRTAETVWKDPAGLTLADKAWGIVSANLPFGGGFIAGFALGFKLG
jgi:uncharacterized membrane protein (Fun14 family)